MTKVRSREECISAIQTDSAWRKKEIIQLGLYTRSLSGADQETALRAAMVVLYAHWEGFVKRAISLYIDHINEKIQRTNVPLNDHFETLRNWKFYRSEGSLGSVRNPVKFLQVQKLLPCPPHYLLPEDVIDTESNLNSVVLEKILYIAELDYSAFRLREKLIDEKLLAKRNSVAHGDRVKVSAAEYEEAEREIRALLETFQQLIEKAVNQETYKAIQAA